ncbi:hypothetical protein FACS1894133_4250 [Clostridia bacterium]|nr:hypothetical protein FACS1894133_4250 [Clostridia bacterium]
MKDEYTEEDFARGIRNPYYKLFNTEVTVGVHNEAYELFKEIAEKAEVPVEMIMSRCLNSYAKRLQEAE